MAFKYYPTNRNITTPKEKYINDLQATIDRQFSNAPNFNSIEYEAIFGSQIYDSVDVRIDRVINSQTGQKAGDDYRKIIFKNNDISPINGRRYRFADNIWITINTNNYEMYTYSSTLLRCNNTINFLLPNGSIHYEPIAINNNITSTGFEFKKNINVASGEIWGIIQYNDFTKNISINDRYILGVGGSQQAWSVESVNGINLQETFGETPQTIVLKLKLEVLNTSKDDTDNNVADSLDKNYTVIIDNPDITNIVGYTQILSATTKINGENIDIDIRWSSDDDSIVSINEETGEIELLQVGTVNINAYILGNESIYDSISVNVVTVPVSVENAIISPNVNYILQGNSQLYNVNLYDEDNNIIPSSFNIVATNVPDNYYRLDIIDGNTFIVSNIEKYSTNSLTITCTSGLNSSVIEIELRGVW